MSDDKTNMVVKTEIAKPLYYQKLEKSLDIAPFLTYVEEFLKQPLGEDGDISSDSDTELAGVDAYTGETVWNGITTTKEDRIADKKRLYNLSNVSCERQWLVDVLLSDTSDSSDDEEITEEDLQDMLREHVLKNRYKKNFYETSKNQEFMYYGTGLLSNFDKYPEHQNSTSGFVKKKKFLFQKKEKLKKQDLSHENFNFETKKKKLKEEPDLRLMLRSKKEISHRKKSAQSKAAEIMAHRRRKIWANMAKKEIGKVQRYRVSNHKEILTACRRAATNCMRHCRQRAMQSQKNMKEVIWRAKRLTREMQVYWKRFERVERETRRRMEKEAEEQRKLDVELMEAKRQQRKLNFLITQTELYAHFMSRKLGGGTTEDQLRILSQLEEEANPRLLPLDDYDCEAEKEKVRKKVENVFSIEEARAKEFGVSQKADDEPREGEEDKPQPQIFRGTLKGYQIKGMTWLVNLYDQGINGILADEMGLGKTVQSIAFLCHIAEKYSVWGPFLIISPASTLHNWQQEMQRFVPDFKVVPYWGNQQERKILRQFWDQKGLHTKDASFHVVITSYQLVITDIKYFNRIKWQYLILDEAQAIKSTTSMRWKLLLGFNCRNRLLLSGTPIQNSMAELWALLHFIMPSMFDSHDEFNEWFSKDIESHAEHKTSIDEKHLSRLHMILKPFMLRRVKTDVENELSDKIEIMVYCPLTTRQKMLYSAVKKKIRIEDLLHSSGSSYQSAQSITSNLMNLVMQFRKVCNHPELFERREPRSPFAMATEDYIVPALITDIMFPCDRHHLFMNHLSPFSPAHVFRSLFGEESERDHTFSFTRILAISAGELYKLMFLGTYFRWHNLIGRKMEVKRKLIGIIDDRSFPKDLIFTSYSGSVFSHTTAYIERMAETIEHRILRSKKTQVEAGGDNTANLLPPFPHLIKKLQILSCHPVFVPAFLYTPTVKVEIRKSRRLYSSNRRWSWISSRLWGEDGALWRVLWEGENQMPGFLCPPPVGLLSLRPITGWSSIVIPDKQTLVTDAGKLYVLDGLLTRLKEQGHRALIYSQMTRMIDLLEEYMWYKKHTYMRLDGSSKISDRRDMVADFQTREDIFVFLLSTRAGGLGINLTAADTVIFYDSDWNPTVDQQAMDRAHRLGQTKQVTVYRLICKGTIEERILQRAQEKSEIQRVVISGGNFKPDTLKPKEVVSLLLDDAEIEHKYRQKQAERRLLEESRQDIYRERERKRKNALGNYKDTVKHMKTEDGVVEVYQGVKSPAESPKGIGQEQTKSSQDSNDNTDQEDPISQTPPKVSRPFMPDRVRSRRGRPPRNSHRGNVSRPVSVANMPPIALSNRSNRRGPGRPRLRPVGPGHIGSRGPRGLRGPGRKPSLPALSIRPTQASSQSLQQNHQQQVENSS